MQLLTIGVDIGGITGIAAVKGGKLLSSTVKKLVASKVKRPERLTHLRGLLVDTIQQSRRRAQYKNIEVDYIQYETPFCLNRKGYATLCMYAGVIEQTADEYGIKVRAIDNKVIKEAVVGSGSASKPDMIACAERLTGRECIWQDEADAIVIAFYGQEI